MKIRSAEFFENKTNVLLFLFIPTLILYAKSFAFGFTPLDEKWLIVDNAEYLKTWKSLSDAFSTSLYHLYYRPLLSLSIFIDYKIAGLSTYFYHVTNLAWHLICVYCLFRLLTLFEVSNKTAAFLSLLFALHPIMVHAVVWVPGRNDLMLCAFTLGSLISLKKYLSSGTFKAIGLHLFLFACALFTKESAISLPLVFFIISFRSFKDKKFIQLAAGWAILALGWLVLRNNIVPDLQPSTLSLADRTSNFTSGFFTYFGKSLFPFFQSVHPTKNSMSLLIGLGTLLVLLFLFFKPGINNKRIAFTGLALFLILLALPLVYSSGRYNPDFYEHRSYTSLCGLVLFFSQIKFNYNSRAFTIVYAVIALFFFVKTFFRMNVYKNENTFLLVAIKEQPDYFLFQEQYANYLSHIGDYAGAIPYYNQAIALRPDKAEFYNDRARAHYSLGNFKAAISDMSSVIRISGFDKDYYLNRCSVYLADNDIENAMKDLYVLMQCCRESVPEDLKKEVGAKWRAILQNLNERIISEPGNADLFYKRSKLFFDTGQKEKGFADLQEAIKLDPQNTEYKKLLSTQR